MNVKNLSKAQLTSNYEAHLSRITNNQSIFCPNFIEQFMQLEVTHTFSDSDYEKIFMNPNEIHRGLLSHEYRSRNGFKTSKTVGERATLLGLNQFVFAYLGLHEFHYAGRPDRPAKHMSPAFGIFISKELESLNTSNASRRDLGSSEIIEPVENEFMLPEDTRRIIALEIEKDYNDNIWDYWGTPKTHNGKSWEKKAEMHFFEKVRPQDITGIIWPVVPLMTHGAMVNSYKIDQQRKFTALFPNINIYEYQWDDDYGDDAFLDASYKVSKYFFENGKYPESL